MTSSLVSIGSGDHHVLAVHGWFGSARGWGSLPEFLDRSTYTYAFMDLRGYGGRQEVPGEFTIEEAAADAIALADELGWDRFSVIGHAMGAKIAHQVLLQAPDRVDRLIGLNPVPASAVPMDEQGWALFSGAPGQPRQPGGHHRLRHRQQADRDLHQPRGPAFAGELGRDSVRRVPAGVGQDRFLR